MLNIRELWHAEDGGQYTNRRIPGMIVTDRGTLIIYNEARRAASDWAMMDIFCQRSVDNGASFEAPIYLANGTEEHPTVNNPVMVQDRNGRIHFLYCEDYGVDGGRILRRYSDDDGVSWSKPIDLTEATLPQLRNAFALGPGHGIRLQNGVLVIPIWMVPKRYHAPLHSHFPSEITTLYSTDDGEHWHLGDILTSNSEIFSPHETVAAELSDGRVYLSIRHRAHQRVKAISRDGYSQWEDYAPDYALIDPMCFGSIAAYAKEGVPHTLFFANCEHMSSRTHVVIKASMDDGATFPYRVMLDEENGGYVEIAVDVSRDRIYVLYEHKYGESLHLATMNYRDLIPE